MQNDWKTRSDSREKLATWPASQALELAANRRVIFGAQAKSFVDVCRCRKHHFIYFLYAL